MIKTIFISLLIGFLVACSDINNIISGSSIANTIFNFLLGFIISLTILTIFDEYRFKKMRFRNIEEGSGIVYTQKTPWQKIKGFFHINYQKTILLMAFALFAPVPIYLISFFFLAPPVIIIYILYIYPPRSLLLYFALSLLSFLIFFIYLFFLYIITCLLYLPIKNRSLLIQIIIIVSLVTLIVIASTFNIYVIAGPGGNGDIVNIVKLFQVMKK